MVGYAATVVAFSVWGLTPVYFKALAHVPLLEIVAHRVLWACLLLLALAALRRGGIRAAIQAARRRRTLLPLLATTALIGSNWMIYIWAVQSGRILEASLGYYLAPLCSVGLGALVLGERLSGRQRLALAFAVLGVGIQLWGLDSLPSAAILLGLSFSIYALVRKRISVDSATGLLIETLVLLPLALAWLGWLAVAGDARFGASGPATDLLLAAGGLVTTVPLLLFTIGARRLRLTVIGFLQYLAPTVSLLLGVLVYGEAMTVSLALTFACIWMALVLSSWPRPAPA